MLAWIFHLVQITVVGFVGYWIASAVDYKQIAKMISVVSILLALQITIQDVTPTVHKVQNKVNSIQQSVDKLSKLNPF